MHIILINGEKQVGKSTYARFLCQLLDESSNGFKTYQTSYVEPLQRMLESLYSSVYPDEPVVPHYEDLKRISIGGHSGRDWMIQFGNAARNLSEDTLPRIVYDRAKARDEIDDPKAVYVVENWGFPNELDYWRRHHASGHFNIITIHLAARATRVYHPGTQFDGDNRFSLQHLSQFIDPPVGLIARKIDQKGYYPHDPIAEFFDHGITVHTQELELAS